VAFTKAKVAVFLDGCFWHGCPEHANIPVANRRWWLAKIQNNVARDDDTTQRLVADGWRVLRFWEHEDPEDVALRVRQTVQAIANG
jgi:DNA mismatch endonuclease (patch repair protein)